MGVIYFRLLIAEYGVMIGSLEALYFPTSTTYSILRFFSFSWQLLDMLCHSLIHLLVSHCGNQENIIQPNNLHAKRVTVLIYTISCTISPLSSFSAGQISHKMKWKQCTVHGLRYTVTPPHMFLWFLKTLVSHTTSDTPPTLQLGCNVTLWDQTPLKYGKWFQRLLLLFFSHTPIGTFTLYSWYMLMNSNPSTSWNHCCAGTYAIKKRKMV